MSLASTASCSAFAAAMASTPVPVPRSSTRRGRLRLQHLIEQQQAAAGGAVMAGTERQRRLDLDAELVGRHPRRGRGWPCTTNRPARHRHQIFEARLDPVPGLDGVEDDADRDLRAGRIADQPADPRLVGRVGEMQGDIPAPVRPLERGDRGLPSEKSR